MKPEWRPLWAHDRADFLKRVLPGEPLFQHHIELALVDAHQRGKDESQAEIARLNKVISRMQNTMSSQAEQWTRSMAEARREGMEEAARRELPALPEELHEHYAVMSVQTHEHFVKEYAKSAIRAKAQEVV